MKPTVEWCIEHQRHENIPACLTDDHYDDYLAYSYEREVEETDEPSNNQESSNK